jgi:hypothetical protein
MMFCISIVAGGRLPPYPTITRNKEVAMMFVIAEVLDANTFKVSPVWMWEYHKGNVVKAHGYTSPGPRKPDYQKARLKSKALVLGKEVELTNPRRLTDQEQLLCDVYVEGKNLADFFPEYHCPVKLAAPIGAHPE